MKDESQPEIKTDQSALLRIYDALHDAETAALAVALADDDPASMALYESIKAALNEARKVRNVFLYGAEKAKRFG